MRLLKSWLCGRGLCPTVGQCKCYEHSSGKARLSYDVWQVRYIKGTFGLQYFQIEMGLSGYNPVGSQRIYET